MRKKNMFVLIILVLLMASCSGAAMSAQEAPVFAGDAYYEDAEMLGAPMEADGLARNAANFNFDDTTDETSSERMVIKNADLAIVAEDPAQLMLDIGQMAEDMGGFVVESYIYQQTLNSGMQVPHATITVRVPAEKLDAAISQIQDGAVEVESFNLSGQDVTSQYTDLQSQLGNLESAEAQLQEIMEDATKTEDVLDIFNELVAVRGEIEIIKGQMQYYEQAAALSRITVNITADEAVQPIQIGGWHPSGVAKEAIETLVKTLQYLVNAGIWLTIFCVPVGLLLGLPLFFVVRAVIRSRKRRRVESETVEAQPQE